MPQSSRGGVCGNRVLVVEDDDEVRALLSEALRGLGYGVHTAASAEEALVALETAPPDLVLADVNMGAMRRQLINRHPAVGADLVSGMHTLDDVRPIIRHHHDRWDGSGYPDGLGADA
ncbi:MAG TPA: response regulator [Methylomirabilota bacterium]|nr:response regulator [Methylomirabilota bacterium]